MAQSFHGAQITRYIESKVKLIALQNLLDKAEDEHQKNKYDLVKAWVDQQDRLPLVFLVTTDTHSHYVVRIYVSRGEIKIESVPVDHVIW